SRIFMLQVTAQSGRVNLALLQSKRPKRRRNRLFPEGIGTPLLLQAMTLRLFNTLSGQLDELAPSDGDELRMYACGPTVYDYGHIGNFRTFLQIDVLRRTLRLMGTEVRHVMNITDVDDKIIRNAAAAGVAIGEYTPRFEKAFFEDLDALNVEKPEIVARATEHIPEMVKLIEKLAAQDCAYKTEDGSWYFRIAKFPEYGK